MAMIPDPNSTMLMIQDTEMTVFSSTPNEAEARKPNLEDEGNVELVLRVLQLICEVSATTKHL